MAATAGAYALFLVGLFIVSVIAVFAFRLYVIDYVQVAGDGTAFSEGDFVLVQKIWNRYEVGDIVVAVIPGTNQLIIRRIAELPSEDAYLVRADNGSTAIFPEGVITEADIIGKVISPGLAP